MKRRTIITITTVAIATALGAGVAVNAGVGGDDNERSITGDALQRASEAALRHTGEGRVSETEVGDEDSLYEVEVTLEDGSQVDVQLDENFDVVSADADSDDPADED